MGVNIVDLVHDKIKANKTYKPRKGVIIAVRAQTAIVRPIGSSTTIPCAFDPQQGVEPDKVCTFIWVQGRKEYVIQSVFSPKFTVLSPDQNPTAFELSPPSNLVHDNSLPGCILLIWDCPPQQDITFEVMYNSSAAEASAQTIRTRAGTAIIPSVDDPTWFRIRSVTEDWRYSSWTSWGSESPGTGAPGGGDSDAIHDNVAGEIHAITEKVSPHSNDELLIEDSESSYAKKRVKISNLPGGSGAPSDATYITQTANGSLSAEQALSSLSTGLMKVTTGTGVISTAAASDLPAHASRHQSGGADSIKLDDFATPDDNTDLDSTTGHHGLLPKLGGGTTNFLRADGSWAAPPGGTGGGHHDLYSQYAAVEIDTTSSETDMFHASSFVGSKDISSGFLIAGSVIEILISGGISTKTTSPGTGTFRFYLDAQKLIELQFNLPANIPYGYFRINANILVESTGGTAIANGFSQMIVSDGANNSVVGNFIVNNIIDTINTATVLTMDPTWQFSVSDASNYLSPELITIRYIDPS